MKNLALLILALSSFGHAQIVYEGGRTQLADTVRWGDADDSASSTLARGDSTFRDSAGTWVDITADSCSLPARLSYGTVMPNSKLELSYEVRTSSGNTDSSQVKWRIDGRYCKGATCESWVPAGRFRGDTSSIIMDSIISVATAAGTTWQPTRQIFDVPGGMQLRLCQDGYQAGGGTNDSTFFRRFVIRNSAIPAGGTPPSNATLTGDITVDDVAVTSSALPTGAATEATLAAASAKLPATLGQKAMAASMAVVLASDQASIPITVASIPSHAVTNAGTFATQAAQSGTWTVQPGNTANTTPWLVDGSGVTQPVSGTVTANAGTGTMAVSLAAFPDNEPFNVAQINGVTPLMGNGVTGTGSQRVTIASDNTAFPVNANPGTAASWGVGATGSAVPANAKYTGAVSSGNLTGLIQADASVKIDVSTATTTELVALTSTQKIYVTSWDVISAGTGTIKLVYGTGAACGTGTTDLTGAYPLIAQSGLAKGNGLGPVLVVPASNALCATTSAAVGMQGSVSYTKF